jgi:hypothetical protein
MLWMRSSTHENTKHRTREQNKLYLSTELRCRKRWWWRTELRGEKLSSQQLKTSIRLSGANKVVPSLQSGAEWAQCRHSPYTLSLGSVQSGAALWLEIPQCLTWTGHKINLQWAFFKSLFCNNIVSPSTGSFSSSQLKARKPHPTKPRACADFQWTPLTPATEMGTDCSGPKTWF